jgi:hypothetical protein
MTTDEAIRISIMQKQLTLELQGFIVTGSVYINTWEFVKGVVDMTEVLLSIDEIDKFTLNDGGWGCESLIHGESISIYGVYCNTNKDVHSCTTRLWAGVLEQCQDSDVIDTLKELVEGLV